jgi:hypothetical protein
VTTISGVLDRMALATAVGRCWGKLAGTVPGFGPVPESQTVLVGAHAFDVSEGALLDSSAVHFLDKSLFFGGTNWLSFPY